jgi:hypothetical protein
MDYLKTRLAQELESIPLGIYSGLRRGINGIFFYHKYGDDFHLWHLYNLTTGEIIKNKTKILDFIACPPDEKRVIPDFFEKVYDINEEIIKDIETIYKEVEQSELVDPSLVELTRDRSKKFVSDIIREIDLVLDEYLLDFPEDKEVERRWEILKERLISTGLTKRRLQKLRALWKDYKNNHKNWKELMRNISEFMEGKLSVEKEKLQPYKPSLLRLVAIDFIS